MDFTEQITFDYAKRKKGTTSFNPWPSIKQKTKIVEPDGQLDAENVCGLTVYLFGGTSYLKR